MNPIYIAIGAALSFICIKKGWSLWWMLPPLALFVAIPSPVVIIFGIIALTFIPKKSVPMTFRTASGISEALVGRQVDSGSEIGYTITSAHVIEGTIREHNHQVYADVDITLSNGEVKRATFEALGGKCRFFYSE